MLQLFLANAAQNESSHVAYNHEMERYVFGHVNSKNVNSGDFWIFMMLLNTEWVKCNKKYASQTCEIKHSNSYISSKVHAVSSENYDILARSQSRVRVAYKHCL